MTDGQRTERKQKDLTNGFIAQHVIYGRLKNHYNNIPRYLIEEAPAHSKTDMEDKIDIIRVSLCSEKNFNPKKLFDYIDIISYCDCISAQWPALQISLM